MYHAVFHFVVHSTVLSRLCLLTSNHNIVAGHFAVFLVGAASWRSVFYCHYYNLALYENLGASCGHVAVAHSPL